MQKGCVWFFTIFTLVVLFSISVHAREYACSAYSSGNDGTVCDPNLGLGSASGLGAVEVCSLCYVCGDADGVCPEDFEDSGGNVANCSGCADPDCTSNIYGWVKERESASEQYIVDAIVRVVPNNPYIAEITQETDALGFYNITAPTGTFVVSASKQGFDTEVVENIMVSHRQSKEINFSLPNGTCHADCSNYFGRCNAECDGIKGCSYTDNRIADLCDDRKLGEWVEVNRTGNSTLSAQCCIGDNTITEFRPPYSLVGDMKDLITTCRPATYGLLPVKVCIATWEG